MITRMTLFKHSLKVELFNTDAYGVIFYSQLFQFTHQVFSAFLKSRGISIQERLEKQDYFFPVVHAEGDYLGPIKMDDLLEIHVELIRLGESSFTLGYRFYKDTLEVAKAQVVHVMIDAQKNKMKIPEVFKVQLLDQPLDLHNCK